MESETKPFEKSLFDENDPKSREAVKVYFASRGLTLLDNEDKYGVDLISEDGQLKVEVERRPVWDKDEFPFKDVNVPSRKAKFFNAGASYVIVSSDFTRIGVINNKAILKFIGTETLKESSNRYVASGELFYKVPKEQFIWKKII